MLYDPDYSAANADQNLLPRAPKVYFNVAQHLEQMQNMVHNSPLFLFRTHIDNSPLFLFRTLIVFT